VSELVDKTLRGTKPDDTPVEQPTKATGKQWTQPIGFVHSLFEVAADIIKRSADAQDPVANLEALVKTNLQTIVGPIEWGKGPVKNVAKTPLVSGQWRLSSGGPFKYDLIIVANGLAPQILVGGKMEPRRCGTERWLRQGLGKRLWCSATRRKKRNRCKRSSFSASKSSRISPASPRLSVGAYEVGASAMPSIRDTGFANFGGSHALAFRVGQARAAIEVLWSCYGAQGLYTRDPLQWHGLYNRTRHLFRFRRAAAQLLKIRYGVDLHGCRCRAACARRPTGPVPW
jgi:hypothetical protein